MNDTGILIVEYDGGYQPLGECLRSEVAEMIADYMRRGPESDLPAPDRFVWWVRGEGGDYAGEPVE